LKFHSWDYFLFFFLALSIAAAIFAGPDSGQGSFTFGYLITAGRDFKTDLGSLGSAVGYFW
jgi:hypothetical protein